jgi:hypothetical protein
MEQSAVKIRLVAAEVVSHLISGEELNVRINVDMILIAIGGTTNLASLITSNPSTKRSWDILLSTISVRLMPQLPINTHLSSIADHDLAISDTGETKAVIASLHFILNNAAKYSCAEETLSNELTQLGLPKGAHRWPLPGYKRDTSQKTNYSYFNLLSLLRLTEHSEGLAKVYWKFKAEMRAKFEQSSLQRTFND